MRHGLASLSEKARRRSAAVEAVQLGHGGLPYRITLFGGSAERMAHGLQDLQHVPQDPAGERLRRPGGGKKKTEPKQPEVIDHVQFLQRLGIAA